MRTFRTLLVNSGISTFVSMFLWFALTFWVYIETESVITTAVIGGLYALLGALLGVAFGTYVDGHRKKTVFMVAHTLCLVMTAAAGLVYVLTPRDSLTRLNSPWLWLMIVFVMSGAIAGNLRAIAISTCVTLLVAEHERDRANGMSGMVIGAAFTVTSIFSGLVIGGLGMGWALLIAGVFIAGALGHMSTITIEEDDPAPVEGGGSRIDFRGAWTAIRSRPGLLGLVLFAAVNNLLGGVFMALMDAYGLSMVSVEAWGILWAVLSLGFIVGGLIVSRFGLGARPLRLILLINVANWSVCVLFPLRQSIVFLAIGMAVWLTLMPIVEAAEQTTLQRAVPLEEQGRVFGFAQMIEQGASPLTTFLVGPLAQYVFMPAMDGGWGSRAIGSWFGNGRARGMALLFVLAGVIGAVITLRSFGARWYRALRPIAEPELAPAAA